MLSTIMSDILLAQSVVLLPPQPPCFLLQESDSLWCLIIDNRMNDTQREHHLARAARRNGTVSRLQKKNVEKFAKSFWSCSCETRLSGFALWIWSLMMAGSPRACICPSVWVRRWCTLKSRTLNKPLCVTVSERFYFLISKFHAGIF